MKTNTRACLLAAYCVALCSGMGARAGAAELSQVPQVLSLSGADWRIHEDADGQGVQRKMVEADPAAVGWIAATVPGNIQADLEAARRIGPYWFESTDPLLANPVLATWGTSVRGPRYGTAEMFARCDFTVRGGDPRFEGDGNHEEYSSEVHGVIAYDGAVHQGSGGWTGGGEGRPDPTQADPWFHNESIPLFHIISNGGGVPILFVKGGRPLHVWIKKYIKNIQVDWLYNGWVHGFEVFDPSKDILVEQLMEYFKSDQSLWAGKLNF